MRITKAVWSAAAALAVACAAPGTSVAQVSVTTYHNDIARTGQNTRETVLSPANVNVNQFGKLFTVPVDSSVFAQPLYVPAVTIATGSVNGTFNVLYVATEHDSVYAIDADSGTVYWQASLIPAGGRTVVGDPDIGAGCNDTLPEIGITGTPVIDPVAGVLYVVSKAIVAGSAVQSLHALDLGSGAERLGGPVTIQASVAGSGYDAAGGQVTFSALFEYQRAALLLENGHVIIAWTSHCDVDPWHGWVMSYDAGTLAQEAVFNTTPNGQEGGSWMSGAGVAADAGGNLYLATGNGTWDGVADYSESILKLGAPTGGAFAVLDYFTPSDQAFLTTGDTDLASGGPVLLPALTPSGQQLLALMGKLGTIYVVDRNALGGYCPSSSTTCGAGDPQIFQEIVGASYGVWGAPAYWNGNLYWGAVNDYLKAFSFDTASGRVSSAATSKSPQIFGYPGPTPSVSANGATAGIVWGLDATAYGSSCSGGANCQVLYAYDATDLGTMLYNSSQASGDRDVPGGAVKFAVPTIANGKVYVGSQNAVSAFGELTNAAASAAGPSLNPPPGAYTSAQSVGLSDTTPGAVIYYTTDGTTPTTSSSVYTGPITIASTGPVQAIAAASGYVDSAVGAGVYIINSAGGTTPEGVDLTEAFNSSNIDAIDIDGAFTTNGGIDGHGNALSANLLGSTVTWNGATYAIGIPGQADGVNGAAIALPQGNFTNITLLAAAVNGNQAAQQFVLNYYDGSSTTYTQSISDWHTPQHFTGEAIAVTMAYRLVSTGNQQTTKQTGPYYLYGYSFPIPNGESVESMQLPANANIVVLAIDVTPAGTGTGAATPTFTPAAGAYTTAQTVTLADTTPNAVIYYTTDGSTPTTGSTAYNTPLTVAASTTITAIATATGYTASAAAAATYTIGSTAASPAFSPAAGTYTTPQTVTLSDTTPNAVIYYTTDGSTPTGNSAQYSAPLTLSATTTVNAIALANGYTPSTVAGATYTIDELSASSPDFSPSPGTYASTQTVSLSTTTSGAAIYYTIDGSPPTVNSSQYVSPLTVSVTTTVNAIAVASDYTTSTVASGTYTISALPVAVSLGGVANLSGLSDTGMSVTGGGVDGFGDAYAASLLGTTYTTAGVTFTLAAPGPGSAVTSTTIPLPADEDSAITLLASGVNGAQVDQVFVVTYTDGSTQAFTQSLSDWFTPADYTGETVAATLAYRISSAGIADAGPVHLYTYSFSLNSAKTVQSITLPSNQNVVVLAVDVTIATAGVAAVPTFSPPPGSYASAQSVAVSDATTGAAIYYTTNGTTPTTSSTLYAGPIGVSATTTIQAIAAANAYSTSPVASGVYTITPPAAAPTFSPPAGTYMTAETVTLGDATPNAVIHYTTDGSTPTAGSPIYSGPLPVGASTTIKALATASGYATGPVATAAYTIDLSLPLAATPTFSPVPGSFDAVQYVTLTDATSNASMYYTVDGSTPTLGSTHYTGPIPVDASLTIRAIAVASGHTPSAIASAVYVIALPPPAAAAPVLNPAAGTFDAAVLVVLTDATPNAVIHYTIDGSMPSASSPTYGAPLPIDATTTLNAVAIAAGHANSAIAGGTYVIGTMPPPAVAATPSFVPPPGKFAAVQSVTISDATPGASIYYTINGSASTPYTGPIRVTATTTLQAIATQSNYAPSSVGGGTYTINLPPADAPTFSPASASFTSSESVTLADATPGAAIHYTTDGSTPDASSPTYVTPFALSVTATVRAIAVAANYTNSPVASATYTLTAAPAPKSSGGGGGALGWPLLGGLVLLLAVRPRQRHPAQ